jgi:serine phosphatase RsbU (regulator of sigma subunit)
VGPAPRSHPAVPSSSTDMPAGHRQRATGRRPSGPPPLRILLVEDDEGDAVLVEDLLAMRGESVRLRRARSLAEAQALPLAEVDCALLDLDLPDAAGLAGLRALRAVADGPAILVLTGFDDERRGIEAVAAGAQDYLVKGQVDGDLLMRSIRYAVERRRAERTQQQLHVARLEARENARLERGLLPAPLVDDPELVLRSHYRPGRRRALLGGDFYDAVQDGDGAVQVVIGDVSGHGPDEAALGVALRIAWRTLVLGGHERDGLLATLQTLLLAERQADSVFTTACMVTIAPDRRSADVRVAGHPGPVLIADGAARPLELGAAGPPLGVVATPAWPAQRVTLPVSWSLLLFTDGLIEGRIGDGPRRLGEAGLLRLLDEHEAEDPAGRELLPRVVEAAEQLNGGPLADDVAAVLITRHPA